MKLKTDKISRFKSENFCTEEMPMTDKPIDFESTLKQLQNTVTELETGNLPLEEALDKFQKAVSLSKHCQEVLEKAELKISEITQEGKLIEDVKLPSTQDNAE